MNRGVINGYDLACILGTPVLGNTGRDAFNGWRPSFGDERKITFDRATCRNFDRACEGAGIGPEVAAVCLDGREQWWVWIDANHADAAEALTLDRTGKAPRVVRGARPCTELYLSTEVCARPTKDGHDLCGLHVGVQTRMAKREAEIKARIDERQAEQERKNEAVERAKAELDARIDILVEANIVRDTLKVTAGRSGDAIVQAPIESIVALIDEFALAIGLDR
jgi:hypothetical protein